MLYREKMKGNGRLRSTPIDFLHGSVLFPDNDTKITADGKLRNEKFQLKRAPSSEFIRVLIT